MTKILVIGGTGFIGYHIITEAKKRKWEITSISLSKPKKKRYHKNVNYKQVDIIDFKSLKKKINSKIYLVDDLNINGDYIESQAFAFLAIRSYLGLPISYPSTTNCNEPTIGGTIIKKF